jgi:hypothetical protein
MDARKQIGNFGVDKLKLFTNYFEVLDSQPLEIVPNRKKAGAMETEETPLFASMGKVISGEKAYINAEKYNLTIKNNQFWLEYNPSKYYDSLQLITDPNKIAESLTTIQTEILQKHKIAVDLFSTGMSRVDLTAQSEMENLCSDYQKIISGGKKSSRFNATDYPSGFLIGNKQRQIMMYDKGLKHQIDQQRIRNINKPSDLRESKLLRLETRLLKAESIKTHSQYKNISDLLNGNEDKYFHLYSKCIDDVLKMNQSQIEFIDIHSLTDLIRSIYTQNKRGQWLSILFATFSNQHPSVDLFTTAIKRLQDEDLIHRNSVYKMSKDYESIFHKAKFLNQRYYQDQSDNYSKMYYEIQNKLIKPYKTAI